MIARTAGTRRPGSLAQRLLGCALAMTCAALARSALAETARSPLQSATHFLSPELKAEQADDALNRGMLWVDQGAELWRRAEGAGAASCRSCHGAAETSMRGVAARLPRADAASGQLVNLEGQINVCRTVRQRVPALGYDTSEMLALSSYLSLQSRGMPRTPPTDPATQRFVQAGRAFWTERQGQMNLACGQCHDDNVGRKLRGDTISSAVPNGYPAYRLEWQGMGSLHRRLKACQLGVRAVQFETGSPEYLALEAYLAWRARGEPMEAPAVRR